MNEITFDQLLQDGTASAITINRESVDGKYFYSYKVEDTTDILYSEYNLPRTGLVNSMNGLGVDYSKYSSILVEESDSFTHSFSYSVKNSNSTYTIVRRYDGRLMTWTISIKRPDDSLVEESPKGLLAYKEFMTVKEKIPYSVYEHTIPENTRLVVEEQRQSTTIDRKFSSKTNEPSFDYTIRDIVSQRVIASAVDLIQTEFIGHMTNNKVPNEKYASILLSQYVDYTISYGNDSVHRYEVTKRFVEPPQYDTIIKDQLGKVVETINNLDETEFKDRMVLDGIPYNLYEPLLLAKAGGDDVDEYLLEKTIYFKPDSVGGIKNVKGYDVYMHRYIDILKNRYYALSVENLDNNVFLYKDNLKYDIYQFIEICNVLSLSYPDYKDIIAEEDKGAFFSIGNSVKILRAEMSLTAPFRANLNISRIKTVEDIINVLSLMEISVSRDVLNNLPDNKKYYFSK